MKWAQVVPDICPRELDFGYLMKFVSRSLTRFVASTKNYETILIGGSGTAAVESVISSVSADKAILIINNGAYGKRMLEIAQAYGINAIEFVQSPVEPINTESLSILLEQRSSEISHIAVVHNETTTGLLNPIELIGAICRKFGIEMIVDAMSSFGAVPIQMEEMNISYLIASSNKNLQGMAGVGFIIANKQSLTSLRDIPPKNFYLNLYQNYKYFLDNHQMRFTPPVQTLYALREAIIETMEETIPGRYERYSGMWKKLIEGLKKLGLAFLVEEQYHSKIITSIVEPQLPGYCFEDMHDYLFANGFTIYPGKLHGKNTFRIANIGAINEQDISNFLMLLETYLGGVSGENIERIH
ncbi:2-aminoethylphosphonate--pyruvate transaminase [Paenibacillus hexagrammi]|uniref:2-aminoethylphosphonate--pyruvate transaminase n=1 Tax=Paenibacillus hexagrammi TaxID=2908839 RepID=A0ABY3SGU2_9BACL|nr:2-aminoethylphosphonate--pyruvate transaminase [Paenibacillus sp. YPD9-1]UJF33217.1 2-aminoethylphosphonate--pyruvate transaminase [Paenibacillus sp. YPD9-1]